VARPRARAAVRDLGAAPRGPLRRGRGLAGPAGDRHEQGDRPARPPLPERLRPAGLAPVLERIATRKATTEDGEPLHDLPDAPLPDPRTPAPPRFLPTWDATLLVHARRTGLLPEEYRSRVFSIRNPHSTPTFLVDGAVAGTWRYEKGRIDLEPFAPLAATTTRALHAEADRLAAFHA
jgi:hypothetical protein